MESYSFQVLLSNASHVQFWIYCYWSRWSYEFCVHWALLFFTTIPGRYHWDVKRHCSKQSYDPNLKNYRHIYN
ncbi:hypothetical protein VNO80_29516 [Phaseolus coccineus]|uniref:Uncharacterized protein n=1 Tax=Phaseolus coccineus TaxID=3886 RepID=A0AAN9LBL3_PHACN